MGRSGAGDRGLASGLRGDMADGLASQVVGIDQAGMALYRIGEMAQQTGLSARAIRLYEEEGLLRPSHHVRGANRLYTAADLDRLKQIAGLRDVGFSIAEIRELLEDDALRRRLSEQYQATDDPAERRRLLRETMALSERLVAALERRCQRVQALLEEERARVDAMRERLASLKLPEGEP